MKTVVIIAVFFIALAAGCASDEKQAAGLLETARFEEKQNNREHAAKLYDEIVKKFPASASAKEAAARLDVLKPAKP